MAYRSSVYLENTLLFSDLLQDKHTLISVQLSVVSSDVSD